MGRRPGVLAGRSLPRVERHPQRPHAALGRDDRRVGAFRQPAGYSNGHTLDRAGSPGQLRARQPAGHPHRARRHDHGARRPLRRQAAEQPERRRRAIRRLDLVHRPGLRHRQRLRGPSGRQRDRRLPRLPVDPATGDVRVVADDFVRPNGLAFSLDESPPLHRRHQARTDIRVFDVADDGALSGGEVFVECSVGRSTASASTTPGGSGPPPATACTASTPTAP